MLADVNNTLTTTLGAEPTFSPDSIDLLAAKDIGAGSTLKMVFFVTTAITSGTATFVKYQVGLADDTAGLNFTVIAETDFKLFAAALAAPTELRLNHIYGSIGKRHLLVRYVSNDNSNFTGGVVVAKLAIDADSGDGGKPYPSGFTV